MKSVSLVLPLAPVVASMPLVLSAQQPTTLEVELTNYRTEVAPNWLVCPDGTERKAAFDFRWIIYDANVNGVLSGEFDEETVSFASQSGLHFQCVELEALPVGRTGEELQARGASFVGTAAYCGDFRPRCEGQVCYWDGWYLELDDLTPEYSPREPEQSSLELVGRFLEVRNFVVLESLVDLPADVQTLLPRWEDGTFAIAEKGENWNSTDVINSCSSQKRSQHWMSGVTNDLAVTFFRSGGIAVFSNVRIMDRRTGDILTCWIDGPAMREWDGSNHTESMFPPSLNCWS